MATRESPRKPQEPPKGKSDTWLMTHGWQRTWVNYDDVGRHHGSTPKWIPPETFAKKYDLTMSRTTHFKWTPDELLKIYLIWHHLKKRREKLSHTNYGFPVFLRSLLEDLDETQEILQEIGRFDQTEALRAFEHTKGIHGEHLRALDLARVKYMARQAAREPDPLA